MKMKCTIFRCTKQQEMYLYVLCDKSGEVDTEKLPEALLKHTGRLEKAMDLELTPERTLARVDVNEVIQALKEKGIYIQMPPGPNERTVEERLRDLSLH